MQTHESHPVGLGGREDGYGLGSEASSVLSDCLEVPGTAVQDPGLSWDRLCLPLALSNAGSCDLVLQAC